jgi:hypothetical protein
LHQADNWRGKTRITQRQKCYFSTGAMIAAAAAAATAQSTGTPAWTHHAKAANKPAKDARLEPLHPM